MLQIIIIVLTLAADQLSKCLMEQLFTMPGESIEVIPGVFNLTYVQNKGASFGILQDRQAFFIVITFAVLIAATWAMIKYRKTHKRFLKVSIALAYAGAIGNLIDRIQFGYVRDFIDIRVFGDLWKWIFNVADMCLVVGSIMLGIYILFIHKDKPKDEKGGETEPGEMDEPEDGAAEQDNKARLEEPTEERDEPNGPE
jgi:signal peptidase II